MAKKDKLFCFSMFQKKSQASTKEQNNYVLQIIVEDS